MCEAESSRRIRAQIRTAFGEEDAILLLAEHLQCMIETLMPPSREGIDLVD